LVPELAARHPGLSLVVDHLGKPPIRERAWLPWAKLLASAAEPPNVVAKLSGLNTAAAPGWSSSDFTPYVEHACSVFGPTRLMYGGDWPFARLAARSYEEVWNALLATVTALPEADRLAILGDTARRVYRLPACSATPARS
jgi:L-fuconolactonase